MTDTKYEMSSDFFKKNEREQNILVSKIVRLFPVFGIAMIVGNLAGVFPGILKITIILTCSVIFHAVLINLCCHFNPEHPGIKYYIIITTELSVFIVTVTKGFSPFIIYALAPLISCIYFNRKFCLFASTTSYFAMIISILIRSLPDNPLNEGLSSSEWAIAYGIGLSLEYALNVVILYLMSLKHLDMLNENLEAINTFQTTQEELITSYSELISRAHPDRNVNIKRCQAVVSMLCEILDNHPDYSGLKNEDIVNAVISSVPLHDIGLIGIPDSLVAKNTAFTAAEKKEYGKHVAYGEELIRKNFYLSENREFLKIARLATLHHHERWDGTGYPDGLMGPAIPICARIIAVADELEFCVSGDNEHKPVMFDTALAQIQKQAGTAFDPVIVEAMLSSRISLEKLYSSSEGVQNSEH